MSFYPIFISLLSQLPSNSPVQPVAQEVTRCKDPEGESISAHCNAQYFLSSNHRRNILVIFGKKSIPDFLSLDRPIQRSDGPSESWRFAVCCTHSARTVEQGFSDRTFLAGHSARFHAQPNAERVVPGWRTCRRGQFPVIRGREWRLWK